jgi:glyoxylase-like metal-dependent hydrolase (beta-lactamase superfamily II)/rhodanese-related sulfurtransferase
VRVEVISTEELGDRSYVAHDGTVAVVVDPQRDLDRVEDVLRRLELRVELVLETHIHNDYVTGGFELARRSGARYAVSAADPVGFDRLAVTDGDELAAGSLQVRVVATPGHTDGHLAYVISDTAEAAQPPAVFTGGSLLYGSVGRTDLVDPARTAELAAAQFRSAHRLADLLPDDAPVFPTHGFGSFCSSGSATGGDDSTIGAERVRNDALVTGDERAFIDALVAHLTAYPAYYAYMGARNLAGPGAADLSLPATVEPAELARRIAAGEWVIDLRDRVAYAADHAEGTVSIELGKQFATYVGWLIPWGAPITVLGESSAQVLEAVRQLVRIGIDRLAGAASGPLAVLAGGQPRRGYRRVGFREALHERPPGDVLLDVRRADERASGALPGSLHIPIDQLVSRVAEVPARRVWVHCASGFRAGIAASLLDRAGHDVVHIDDEYATLPAEAQGTDPG